MLHVTAGSKTCDARVRSEIYPDTHTLLTVSPFESNGNMMKYVLSRLLIHVEPLSLKLERIVGTVLYGAVELQLPLLGVLAAVCSVVKGRWQEVFFVIHDRNPLLQVHPTSTLQGGGGCLSVSKADV